MSFEDMEKVRLLAQQAVACVEDLQGAPEDEKTSMACQMLESMAEEIGIKSPPFFTETVVIAQTKLYRALSNGNAYNQAWKFNVVNTNSTHNSSSLS